MKLLLAVAVLIAVGCNKKDESPVSTSTPPDLGTYQACINEDDGSSSKSTVLLSETAVSATTVYYGTSNCDDASKMFMETDLYSYTLSGTAYTLTYESLVITSVNASMTSAFNTNSLCGYTNWSTNTPKKMIGVNCGGTTISAGDQSSLTMYKSKGSLVVSDGSTKQVYTLVQALSLNATGTTLQNGTYIFYDGSRGVHLTFASPNFQVILYDAGTKRFYTKNGTYNSSSNIATFSTVSSTPSCTDTFDGSHKFQSNSYSMGLEGLTGETWLLEKVGWTSTQFKDTFLEAGYTQTCF